MQLVSAKEHNAYPGSEIHRTMALINDTDFEKPIILDIVRVTSETENQYDLPYYFMGQVLLTNFEYDTPEALQPLGTNNGFQHLYLEGTGIPSEENTKLSWLRANRFYTLTSATKKSDNLLFTRIGANDPEFNLRRDAGFMLRRKNAKNTTFVSIIESHGGYSPVSEFSVNSNSSVENLDIIYDSEEYTAVQITTIKGNRKVFILANEEASKNKQHTLNTNNGEYQWIGTYYFK